MKNLIRIYIFFIFVVIALFLKSCYPKYNYDVGTFPDTPVNMGNINSVYDDYNSSSPTIGRAGPLCFSSNRSSNGKNFNIIYKLLDVIMRRTDGELIIEENTNDKNGDYLNNLNLNNAVLKINTAFDEFGPYLIPQGLGQRWVGSYYEGYNKYILLYANDESGNLDIKFTENLTSYEYSEPQNIIFLNSEYDDAYPCLNSDKLSFLSFAKSRNA